MAFSEVAGKEKDLKMMIHRILGCLLFIRLRCFFMPRTAKWQSLSMSIGLTTATT